MDLGSALTEQFFYDHLEEILDNTYQVLSKNKEIEDILDDDSKLNVFLFNPREGYPRIEIANTLYDLLIEHYQDMEWYERCQTLTENKKIDNITEF